VFIVAEIVTVVLSPARYLLYVLSVGELQRIHKGVVQCYAGNLERLSCLYFSNISRIELAQKTEISGIDGDISSRTYHWLDVYGNDGTYFEWWTSNCFGDTEYIGKSIIAAYNYYWCNNSL
jgi:hypothetical protein